MGKIDKIKEDIGAFKVYQGFVVVSIITIGTGVAKLYLENTEFCNDMCSCVIRDLPNNTLGEFDIKNHIFFLLFQQ